MSRHIMGTCRMGDDPRTSVVDPWQRFHDVENMVCTDPSVFPTSTGYGPTLTIVALAIRACREARRTCPAAERTSGIGHRPTKSSTGLSTPRTRCVPKSSNAGSPLCGASSTRRFASLVSTTPPYGASFTQRPTRLTKGPKQCVVRQRRTEADGAAGVGEVGVGRGRVADPEGRSRPRREPSA